MTLFQSLTLLVMTLFPGPLRVTNLSNGSHVAQAFSLQGQAAPGSRVEIVAEYPPSKLPGYENYHDVLGSWTTVAGWDGSFTVPIELTGLPHPAPLALYLHQGSQASLRLDLKLDR